MMNHPKSQEKLDQINLIIANRALQVAQCLKHISMLPSQQAQSIQSEVQLVTSSNRQSLLNSNIKTGNSPLSRLNGIIEKLSNRQLGSEPFLKTVTTTIKETEQRGRTQSHSKVSSNHEKRIIPPYRKKSLFQQQHKESTKNIQNQEQKNTEDNQLGVIHQSLSKRKQSEEWCGSCGDLNVENFGSVTQTNKKKDKNAKKSIFKSNNNLRTLVKAKSLNSKQRNKIEQIIQNNNKSKSFQLIQEKEKRYDIAIQYYSEAYEYFNSIKTKQCISQVIYICISMAECYLSLKKYTQCQGLLKQARKKLQYCNEIRDINQVQTAISDLQTFVNSQFAQKNSEIYSPLSQFQQQQIQNNESIINNQNLTSNQESTKQVLRKLSVNNSKVMKSSNRFHDSFIELQSPIFFRLAMHNPHLLDNNQHIKTKQGNILSPKNAKNQVERKEKRFSSTISNNANNINGKSRLFFDHQKILSSVHVRKQSSIERDKEIEEDEKRQSEENFKKNSSLFLDLNKNMTFQNRTLKILQQQEQTQKSEMKTIEEELKDSQTPTSSLLDDKKQKLQNSPLKSNFFQKFSKGFSQLFSSNESQINKKVDQKEDFLQTNQKQQNQEIAQNQKHQPPQMNIQEHSDKDSKVQQSDISFNANHMIKFEENNIANRQPFNNTLPPSEISQFNNQQQFNLFQSQIKEPDIHNDKKSDDQSHDALIQNTKRPFSIAKSFSFLSKKSSQKQQNLIQNSTILPQLSNRLQKQLIESEKQKLFLPYSVLLMKLNLIEGKLNKSQGIEYYKQAAEYFVQVLEYKDPNNEDDKYDPQDKMQAMKELLQIFQFFKKTNESNQIYEEITRFKTSSINLKMTGRPLFFIDSFS